MCAPSCEWCVYINHTVKSQPGKTYNGEVPDKCAHIGKTRLMQEKEELATVEKRIRETRSKLEAASHKKGTAWPLELVNWKPPKMRQRKSRPCKATKQRSNEIAKRVATRATTVGLAQKGPKLPQMMIFNEDDFKERVLAFEIGIEY